MCVLPLEPVDHLNTLNWADYAVEELAMVHHSGCCFWNGHGGLHIRESASKLYSWGFAHIMQQIIVPIMPYRLPELGYSSSGEVARLTSWLFVAYSAGILLRKSTVSVIADIKSRYHLAISLLRIAGDACLSSWPIW